MSKLYCRNCQEKLKVVDGKYSQVVLHSYVDPVTCRATGEEHVPR